MTNADPTGLDHNVFAGFRVMSIHRLPLNLYRLARRFRSKLFTLAIRSGFHSFGSRSVFELPVRLGGEHRISVGKSVFVGSNCWFEVLNPGPDGGSPVISIGDNCSLSGFCTITATTGVIVETGVLVARYVHISDHSHAFEVPNIPIKDQGIGKTAPVRIGRGAWLGQGVVVCPGVTIGAGSVIGANSVVRSDIPDRCVAAGAPAKVIRRLDAPRT